MLVGKGLDGIPLNEYREMGVKVANGGDSNATSVAETAINLILASARNLVKGIYLIHVST